MYGHLKSIEKGPTASLRERSVSGTEPAFPRGPPNAKYGVESGR